MRGSLLAVAVLATIAISSAVDKECLLRRARGLPVHWPNPTDCSSFYRCTNKNIKRELLCPEGKEYNPSTGRCASKGKNLCKLSLRAPLADAENPCAGVISGTSVPAANSCRGFNICNNNVAYPQSCDAGSYFNTELLACEPDTDLECWENLCVNKKDGDFVANDKDCYSFYVCLNEQPKEQLCPKGSYFNREDLNCQPGTCPETTTPVTETTTQATDTTPATETSTPVTETSTPATETSTPETETTTPVTETSTPATETSTPETETSTPETETTTPVTETSTPVTETTTCTTEITTPTTTTCIAETTSTTTCSAKTTTTTSCAAGITTPTTTTCTTTTTAPTTTTCTTPTTTSTTTTCTTTTKTTTCTTTTTTCTTTTTTCTTTTTTCTTTTSTTTTCTTTASTTTTCTTTTTTCTTTTTTCTTPTTTTTCTTETTTTCVAETTTTTTCTTTITTTTTCTTTTTTCTTTTTTCTTTAPTTTTCTTTTSTTTTCTTPTTTTTCTTQTTTTCVAETTIPTTTTCTTETTTTCAVDITTTITTTCAPQGDKVCPSSNCLNKPDYYTFPATNTTSGFCRCLKEKAEYYACADDSYVYNEALGVCVKSDDCEDEPATPPTEKLCEGVYKEGDFVPNPDNCMLFYICFDGELEESSCETGNYYDDKIKACMPDTEGKCPDCQKPQPTIRRNKRSIKRAPTCMEGAKTPAADCDMYYKCVNGVQLSYGCGKDKFFNLETLSCEYDLQHKCWPATSCIAGEKRPHPTDCDKYFECCSGTEELKECGKNYYYNRLTQTCTLDTKHVCWALEPCTCPGGYKEGDISAHPDECDKFYICLDGQQVLQDCGKGNYFNKKKGLCELDVDHVCSTVDSTCVCPGGYKDGELSPHPTDCDKYYICVEGTQVLQDCGKDNYFNNVTLTCEPDLYNECWAKTSCTCPGGYEEGDFSAHPTDCNKYYICSDGHQVLQDCGVDNYFNNDTLLCEPDTYHVCWPNLCMGQPKGTLVANPQQCNAYYLCEDDNSTPGTCYEGEYFDAEEGTCLPDFKATCYDPCANETSDGVVLLPHPICNKYYFCNGGKTFVGECVTGSFDPNTGICNETKICQPNPCKGQTGFLSFPYPFDPTKFYVCIKGQAVLEQCGPNKEFDTEHGICMPVSNRDCPACPDMESNTYPTLDGENDREYCYCYHGIAYKSECANGYVYNPDIGTCYSNAPCDPAFCIDKVDYTVAPNRNSTKSFCMCINHKPSIVNCPNDGTFNPFLNECTNVEMSPECDQSSCLGKADGQLAEFTKGLKPNGICVCRSQIATFEPCAYGSTYNPTLKICQQKEINCNSKLCTGLADNTNIPALTTNEGYCKCIKGQATYYNCFDGGLFNVDTAECDASICPLSQCKFMGDSFKPTNTSAGTCVCLGDSVEYVPCGEGQLYSEEFSGCADKCKLSLCPANQANYNIPSAISKHNYCTCDVLGNAVFKECSPQYYSYNMAKQQCEPDVATLCPKTCTTTVEAYEAEGTLEGYCICNGKGQQIFQTCGEGTIYNPNRGICVPMANSLCNVEYCQDATIDSPITMPAEDDDKNVFCYCSGPNDVMVLTCPAGKEYVHELRMCVNPLEANSKCPAGTANGDKIPDDTSCNKYFICENGQMELKTCPMGQYFNKNTNNCCVDTQGICPAQTECTCLGAYYEGEMIKHPIYEFMYYMCENGALNEYKCPKQQVFSAYNKACVRQSYGPRKRSIDMPTITNAINDHEFNCLDNEKRSVPSNCSQYEVCINQNWQLETCPNYRYYNPEQKECLEPRDDFVCSYARITSLPPCDDKLNHQVYQAKSCYQYYRCENGKWRLKSCGREHYFQAHIKTCLPILQDTQFQCNLAFNKSFTKIENQALTCQHLSQRFYTKNCAMFLICLDNEWWYQYCPPGMYFNRSLNYCVPDLQQECKDVIRNLANLNIEKYSQDVCNQDGLLRPSAMACNRYYVCLNGKWQVQRCAYGEFYDVANVRCSPDIEGQCIKLNRDCWLNEKRSVARNCSLYEQCSSEGKWIEMACKPGEIFDELLQQCVGNQGICSKHGLKRVCRDNEFIMMASNCTQFYYCSNDSWQVGSCLKGYMFLNELKQCVPHLKENICSPLASQDMNPSLKSTESQENLCQGKLDGSSVAHPTDCTRYYICIQETTSHEIQCPQGSYFEPIMAYCRPNDGSCRVPLSGACANATDNSLIAHPTDCQAFYHCSTVNGTELLYCSKGEYFHNQTLECRPDKGECKNKLTIKQKCAGLAHGSRIAHETYCNIYYACVKGLAIPVECPDNYQFSALLSKCVFDKEQQCQNGQLINGNVSYSCGNLADGSFLADRSDCTRYFICTEGQAFPKKCANSSYFDNELLLCVPDDGSCPFVTDNGEQPKPTKPDPEICEGKHGYIMADPINCNNFYVCIHNKLKHERCYSQQFFNSTTQQCQPIIAAEMGPKSNITTINEFKAVNQQCLDEFTSTQELCKELTEGTSLAEPGDCRRYLTCQEADEQPLPQRCRNGESFDSLLGFCRQNDGTCLMENGQRVGECSGKHGQLARDPKNCRSYFVCINGQKIAQTCNEDEYFSRTRNMCLKDTQHVCNPAPTIEEPNKQSCVGLSESTLYPYIQDNCRSYFQCIKGVAKIHKCADELYFDPIAIKCVKNITECVMSTQTEMQTLQRSPAFDQKFSKLCSNKVMEVPYANIDNDCRSFYICHTNGEITHELCPLGKIFNKDLNICFAENKTICQ